MGQPKTVIVARDPGAANALAPVAAAAPATVAAFPYASPYFDRAGLEFLELAADSDFLTLLDGQSFECVLTGTSTQPAADATLWAAARQRSIPSLALLDHWVNYAARFSVSSELDSLPDRILVMDGGTKEAFCRLGVQPECLAVTGQPAFDRFERPRDATRRERVRARWGVSFSQWVVLFAGEPIEADGLSSALGYNERDVLAVLIESLAATDTYLVVKPHPRQQAETLAQPLTSCAVPAYLEGELSADDAIAGADTVVGMTSILLLEAALAGLPVLSIQPSAARLGPFLDVHSALIDRASSVSEARIWLARHHHRPPLSERERLNRNHRKGFDGQAAPRVWAEIARLVSNKTVSSGAT